MSSSGRRLLTSSQARAVDRICEERFGISVEWLMEAAGWAVAREVEASAAVVCGVGNNGGDGLAAARHLHRWGRLASVSCIDIGRLRGPAAKELEALQRIGVKVTGELELNGADWIVDAIFGTGLSRPPEGKFKEWIETMNASGKTVLAVDVPSGLNAETGVAYSPTVHATLTLALGLPKPGLSEFGERVIVADIGIPNEAYAAVGVAL